LGLISVDRRNRCARTRLVAVRSGDDNIAEGGHCSSEIVKSERIDTVIVGYENAHPFFLVDAGDVTATTR